MIADGDCFGKSMATATTTPLIDASAASQVSLTFDHDFLYYSSETATVKARSTKTGGAWVNLIQWQGVDASGTVVLDVTTQCAGTSDCQFNWDYASYGGGWWAVDNVGVQDPAVPWCNPSNCPPVSLIGDTDINGCIDGLDLMRLARAFGTQFGEADFHNDADLNNDGWVDGIDLMTLAWHFGSGCGGP